MGKSALAVQFALAAAKAGVLPAVFSMEMEADSVVDRIIAMESEVPEGPMRRGYLEGEQATRVVDGIARLSRAQVLIDDVAAMTPVELRARSMMLDAKERLGLIVVDYLQLMHYPAASREGRQEEIAQISRQIKALARDLAVPVIVVSQLNRRAEERADKRPALSDLRESGALEQDADKVLLVYRPGYYAHDHEDRRAEITIAKHRNGPTGVVEATFIAQEMRFAGA